MKHCILMLIHENIELVNKLIELYPKEVDIYIHIDASSDIDQIIPVKSVIKKVACEWGEPSLVDATVELIKEAGNNYDYYHLVSGSCLPICTIDDLNKLEYPKCYIHKCVSTTVDYGKIWYGQQWFTLSNVVIQYIFNNLEEIEIIKNSVPLGNIADEIVFNTIVMNHFENLIINDSKRFIDWYGVHPRYITKEDNLDGYLFARKVNLDYFNNN